jgi:choline dehydrogenase-like flavoprotein
MYLNIDSIKEQTYDAIVVGSGISGGIAAKELTEKGLKTLVLERGREIKHIEGYETANLEPWMLQHRNRITTQAAEEYYTAMRTGYTPNEDHRYLFESDKDAPYIEKRPFDWTRAYHTGGKSLLWGRQSYRFNEEDFMANLKDGNGVDWPVRYADIAPWYSYVEKYVGVSGTAEGLSVLPDSIFLPAMNMTAPEIHLKKSLKDKFGRPLTIGRVAHITKPGPQHTKIGRAQCQHRNKCMRGCPYGGYYSSLAGGLASAAKTGNMYLVHNAIVSEVIYDEAGKRAKGVRVIDQNTLEVKEYFAKIIFLNAGAIQSTSILMNSKSNRFQNGMGNDSDQLGRNIMDHHLGVGAYATEIPGFDQDYYFGGRPNGLYIPRFQNWAGKKSKDYLRGFGYQGGASREGWARGGNMPGFGAGLKEELTKPGHWTFGFSGFGEILPNENNRFTLHPTRKDKWGLPLVEFDAALGENERNMRKDMAANMAEMFEAAGFKGVGTYNSPTANIGLGIHEMGTARMGRDKKTSVLNKFNQIHDVKNVFVTDGSFMASASCVNPSLTYMAFTARAADYAVKQLKAKSI